jgi:O-antigen ligase
MAMGKTQVKSNKDSNLKLVLVFAALITLYFNSKIQDPFNSPKLWLLLILVSILISPVLSSVKLIKTNIITFRFTITVGIFLLALLLSALFTENYYLALIGETQRKLGFLTYFCLAILMLYAMLRSNFQNIKFTLIVMSALGLFFAIYGQFQHAGQDFVTWNNPYNSIIGSLGNPNYAAALMAIMGVASFGVSFSPSLNKTLKTFGLLNSMFILYTIYLSNARQGLISYSVGICIILTYYLYSKRKIYGSISLGLFLVLGAVAILGMLQIGPLTNLLYKSSVTIRGYYWAAGIEMFKDNPFFGVGVDSYGDHFKQYRDVNYPLKYGFDITSTNAHNVFIQFFSTGGFLVGISYVVLMILVLRAGLRAIKFSPIKERPFCIALFACWVSFQAQSVISIDNIGLTIWGWILGGILVGLHKDSTTIQLSAPAKLKSRKSIESIQLLNYALSVVFILGSTILISNFYKGEKNALNARVVFDSELSDKNPQVYKVASETFLINLNDPTYKMASAYYMAVSGFKDEGFQRLERIIEENPRNYDALNLLAGLSEQFGLSDKAIEYRVTISELDPWNAKNYLRLGNLYKFQGNFQSMEEMRTKILKFAENTPEGAQAKLDLVDSTL